MELDNHILIEPMISNLKILYEFIDKNSPGNSKWKYENGYRNILRKARVYDGSRKYIISKRQVASLINAYTKKGISYVRIPYSADYIFRAIFDIFESYKQDPSVSIPPNIEILYKKIRRDVFYREQSEQYEYKLTHNILLRREEEIEEIRYALLNDICSDECTIGKEF